MGREEDATYQTEQRSPWCEHERGKESGDDLGGKLLLGPEGVGDGRLRVKGRFVGVGCRRGGCGDVEVKEVECLRVVHERAEDQGDGERVVCRRREGRGRTGHVLREKKEKSVSVSDELSLFVRTRTSSNLALPPGVTRTGWMPSSPETVS